MTAVLFLASFLIFLGSIVSSHREHRVHNIVLYPERHSWCKATPIRQVVSVEQCQPLELPNHVCVGTCFSYTIPRTEPEAEGEQILPYCDACLPSFFLWKTVSLNCSDGTSRLKRVQVIRNCSCSDCQLVQWPSHREAQSMSEEDEAEALPAAMQAGPRPTISEGVVDSHMNSVDADKLRALLAKLETPAASSGVNLDLALHKLQEARAGTQLSYGTSNVLEEDEGQEL